MDYLEIAKEVFLIESKSVAALCEHLDNEFTKAVELILGVRGRLVVSGMGKSGHIGSKIAATLASTGTPSFFMHPAEAIHGDLGMITQNDILLAISNSGESEEILRLLPVLKARRIPIIAMSARRSSTLGKNADIFLDISVEKEACPLQLAPTSSTTATLAMGDGLAVALMKARGFAASDFALFHPGGSLGRKLLTKVSDIMKKQIPCVCVNAELKEIVMAISEGKLGMCAVVDSIESDKTKLDSIESKTKIAQNTSNSAALLLSFDKKYLRGIITDGDLRRALGRENLNFKASEIMSHSPKIIQASAKAEEAERLCFSNNIKELLVVEKSEVVGVFQLYSLGQI